MVDPIPLPTPDAEKLHRLLETAERLALVSEPEWRHFLTGKAGEIGVKPAELENAIKDVIKRRKAETRAESERDKEAERNERRRESKEKSKSALFRRLKPMSEDQRAAEITRWCKIYDGEDPDVVAVEFDEYSRADRPDRPPLADEPRAPEPVNGLELVERIRTRIRRHVVIKESLLDACAFWVIYAHLHREIATHSAFLVPYSSVKESGKSTLLGVLSWMVPRRVVMTSPRVSIYRVIDAEPTLLVDEGQRLFENEDLAEIVDASHTRGHPVMRMVRGEERFFTVFCAKAFSMLGRNGVPEASASRCWFIKMKPRLPTEVVEDFLFEDDAEFAGIRAAAARWTADHRDELKKLQQTVAMPEGFADRLRDVFKLVFAVADKIGGGWLARMHAAALEIAHAGDVNISWHRRALQDLRTYFVDERGNVRPWVKSDQFMSWLLSDEDSPWHSYKGRKVTKWQIAALIRVNFEIETKLVGPKRGRARGWTPDQFADDFARVLKDPLPSRSPVHHPSRKPPKR